MTFTKCYACDNEAVHSIKREDGKIFWFCDECCFCGEGDHIIVVRKVKD